MNYQGKKPDYSYYYKSINREEYNEIDKYWCARTDTLKYMKNDVSIVYEVMRIFMQKIVDDFGILWKNV